MLIYSKLSIIGFRHSMSTSSSASRLWSSVNHYKFIKNNLIPEYRSSENHRIHRSPDFRCRSTTNRKGENLSKHALSKARSQINISGFKYGNTNSDVWKFIRADNSDKPWIREYSNTLRTSRDRGTKSFRD